MNFLYTIYLQQYFIQYLAMQSEQIMDEVDQFSNHSSGYLPGLNYGSSDHDYQCTSENNSVIQRTSNPGCPFNSDLHPMYCECARQQHLPSDSVQPQTQTSPQHESESQASNIISYSDYTPNPTTPASTKKEYSASLQQENKGFTQQQLRAQIDRLLKQNKELALENAKLKSDLKAQQNKNLIGWDANNRMQRTQKNLRQEIEELKNKLGQKKDSLHKQTLKSTSNTNPLTLTAEEPPILKRGVSQDRVKQATDMGEITQSQSLLKQELKQKNNLIRYRENICSVCKQNKEDNYFQEL